MKPDRKQLRRKPSKQALIAALEKTDARLAQYMKWLGDDLQILEMQKGYQYLISSQAYATDKTLQQNARALATLIAALRNSS